MWCEAEIKKALRFVPGYIGISPEYPQQMGKPFGPQAHQLLREHPHFDGRSSKRSNHPCIRIEMMPNNLERGDSEYRKCSTCTYDRYVRPAGLPSEDMWRLLDLEGQREPKTKETENNYKTHDIPEACGLKHCYKRKDPECSTCAYERSAVRDYDRDLRPAGLPSEDMWKLLDLEGQREPKTKETKNDYKTHDGPKSYYSRHEAHFPSHYLHYEGYWGEDDNSAYEHYYPNHHPRGHHHRVYGARDHGHYDYRYLGDDHGQYSKEQKLDNPVSVSIRVNPRKSKGKFYMPAIYGDYNLEKNKVSIQIPDKHCRKREHFRDRKEIQVKSAEENLNKRYDTPDRDGKKFRCKSSLKKGAIPICAGIIAGIQLYGPMAFGNSSGRMWKGNCY